MITQTITQTTQRKKVMVNIQDQETIKMASIRYRAD